MEETTTGNYYVLNEVHRGVLALAYIIILAVLIRSSEKTTVRRNIIDDTKNNQ